MGKNTTDDRWENGKGNVYVQDEILHIACEGVHFGFTRAQAKYLRDILIRVLDKWEKETVKAVKGGEEK